MLHLFQNAADSMKKEGEGSLGKKVDKLVDQNETIAESILSLVDMIRKLQTKVNSLKDVKIRDQPPSPKASEPTLPPEPKLGGEPELDFPAPPTGIGEPQPKPQPMHRELQFPKSEPIQPPGQVPPLRQPIKPEQGPPPTMPLKPPGQGMPPPPPKDGPVAMPSGSFSDLDIEKPAKKGLFGK